MFVLLKSRVFFRDLDVRPVEGVYAVEEGTWRWTAKRFALQVTLPLEQRCTGFTLDLYVPQAAVTARPVNVTAFISGAVVGSAARAEEGIMQLTGTLPETALHEPVLRIWLEVDGNGCKPDADGRELGLCLPLSAQGRIPLSVY